MSEQEASRAARDQLLAKTFRPHELVWLIDEQYVEDGPMWRVTLVRQGLQGHWLRQRYRYDIASHILHFTGEQPISDADLASARATGRLLA
jgi:hypothetical protein